MSDPVRETGTEPMIRYNERGLAPAIVQDDRTGEVLMMAWMNAEALRHTRESGKATFYSRSRGKIWVKGESSGHVQRLVEMRVDCDQDCILLRVEAAGPACHVGYPSCFYRKWDTASDQLEIIGQRAFDPENVYGP